MKRLCVLLLTSGLLSSCNQYNPGPELESALDTERVRTEVTAALHNYHDAMNEEGLMSEFEYLDSSSSFFWVPPGQNKGLSFEVIKPMIIRNSKALAQVNFQWKSLSVFPLSESIANFHGVVEGVLTDTSSAVNHVRLVESGTVIKRSDGWKLLSGQTALIEE